MAAAAASMLCASGWNRRHRRPCFGTPVTAKTRFFLISKHARTSPIIFLSNQCRFVASAVSGSPAGGAGSSSTTPSEDIASVLEKVEVFDLTGRAVPISDLWKDRKAVVAFARHFGCVLCRKRADFLASKKEIMDASGVTLVLIGPGSVEQPPSMFGKPRVCILNLKAATRHANTANVNKVEGGRAIKVYADPNHSSYAALNFVSGVSTTFTPSAGLKIIQSYLEGYRQDWGLSFEKDTMTRGGWQQGGIIVVGPGISKISYIHKDKEAGDEPNIEDIMKACCS